MPVVLYRKQREILDFISQYIQRFGYAPTLKEIADAADTTVTTIFEHLDVLEKKGVLRKSSGQTRGLEIIDASIFPVATDGIQLPILGFIAAGSPIEPYSQNDAYLPVSPTMVSIAKPHYVLQVRGNSMIDEGILDGDYVVIEHRQDAKDGDIVVAVLETGLATLKRIFFENDRVKLAPANTQMSPIWATNVKIQGRVVGVIRRYQSS